MKYYAVYKGKSVIPKIYTSWDECKKDVIGFKGAIYKSFTTEKEAKEFISLNSQGKKLENIQDEESESGLFIYVDGSFTVDKGNFSYGLVAVNDGKIIYDTCGFAKETLQKCKTIYDNGPDKICEEEKRDKMLEIKSKIKKLESKDEFEEFEYDFFINIALRDLIRMYYIKNDKWVPKDKKLLKSIKKDDKNIYDILKNESFNKYEMLLKIYKYIK